MQVVKVVNGYEVITYNDVESICIHSDSRKVVLRNCEGDKFYIFLSKNSHLMVFSDG